MKNLLSILLTITMLVSLCVQAFADEPDYTSGTGCVSTSTVQ